MEQHKRPTKNATTSTAFNAQHGHGRGRFPGSHHVHKSVVESFLGRLLVELDRAAARAHTSRGPAAGRLVGLPLGLFRGEGGHLRGQLAAVAAAAAAALCGPHARLELRLAALAVQLLRHRLPRRQEPRPHEHPAAAAAQQQPVTVWSVYRAGAIAYAIAEPIPSIQ